MQLINRRVLEEFLCRLNQAFAKPGTLYLTGETSQLFEGWRDWVGKIEVTADISSVNRAAYDEAVAITSDRFGIELHEEFPGDLIPLPDGFMQRSRPIALSKSGKEPLPESLQFCHFDPFSVCFRYIARGDEQDYRLVLDYMKHGWVSVEEMTVMLDGLLSQFSYETIQQDPAEFRRKYKGLLQMWQAMDS